MASETHASRAATILTAALAMAARMVAMDGRQATAARIAALRRPMTAEPTAVRLLPMIVARTAGLLTEKDVPRRPTAGARCLPTVEAGVEPRTVAEAVELLMVAEVGEGRPVDSVAEAVHLAVPVVEAGTMAAEAEDRTEDVADPF